MPELPEVETIRRQLAPRLVGRAIVGAWGFPAHNFADASLAAGAAVTDLRRRGKYLIATLDDDRELIVHLGMTGAIRVADPVVTAPSTPRPAEPTPREPHVRATWALDTGELMELHDPRRFGRVAVVPAGDYGRLPTLASLGPEPFGSTFTPEGLWQALAAGRAHTKTKLLGQRVVAGVGNIYADEALWRARINPSARYVSRPQAERLHQAVIDVLREGVEHGGTTLRDYRGVNGAPGGHQHHLACYGRHDEPCERCGTLLRRRVLDGRGTTWCPACQRS